MTVRFSICIPVWNERDWLSGAIESVLAQGHQDWELIIGDNASSEDLYGVAARYEDERIRYHRWDTHTDIYENFNRTALLSHFEWVQILCADDRLKPDCLAKMAARVEEAAGEGANLSMVLTACSRVDLKGKPADEAYYGHQRVMSIRDGTYDGEGWLDAMAIPGQTPWNYGSVALSRRVFSEMGSLFRPEIGLCADVELALRASAYGDVAYIGAPMLNYTVRGNSDMPGRALRNLREGDPQTPIGLAWLAALRSHEQRRAVSPQQRRRILDVVARSHLQRALQHRLIEGGHGRRGAAKDIWRAFSYSPALAKSPWHLATAGLSLAAPASMIRWSTERLAQTRRGSNSMFKAALR